MELAGTLRKMSALFLAGSPWRTAIRHPFGRNAGQGPHLSWESFAVRVRGGSCADTGAPANAPARSSPDISATFSDCCVMVRQYTNHLLLVKNGLVVCCPTFAISGCETAGTAGCGVVRCIALWASIPMATKANLCLLRRKPQGYKIRSHNRISGEPARLDRFAVIRLR